MTITLLMENTAREGLAWEHGLSFHIAWREQSILLDAGSSGSFADNAQALGIDLKQVSWGALSHGHYDHADGLRRFFQLNASAPVYIRESAGEGYYATRPQAPHFVGIHRELWQQSRHRFVPLSGAFQPQPGVWLLPGTVAGGPFASRESNLLRKVGEDRFVPDDFSHEQSLVFETEEGLVIFNSCCHGGVVNIVRGVRQQLGEKPVRAVLGGMHMLSPGQNALNCPPEYVLQVADALLREGVGAVYTGHCTGEAAFDLLHRRLGPRLHALTGGLVIRL